MDEELFGELRLNPEELYVILSEKSVPKGIDRRKLATMWKNVIWPTREWNRGVKKGEYRKMCEDQNIQRWGKGPMDTAMKFFVDNLLIRREGHYYYVNAELIRFGLAISQLY